MEKNNRQLQRRKHFRIKLNIPIEILGIKTKIIDLSLTGLAFKTNQKFQENKFEINIRHPFLIDKLSLKTQLIFSHSITNEQNETEIIYGLKFLSLTKDQKISLKDFLDKIYIGEEIIFDRRSRSKKENLIDFQIANSLIIQKTPQIIFDLLKNAERYKHFMTEVDAVEVINDQLSWTISVNETQIKWQENRIFDEKNRTIKYQQIDGELEGYHGEIKLEPLENKLTNIKITSYFKIPSSNPEITKLYKKSIKKTIRLFLKAIKRELELKEKGLENKIIVSRDIQYKNREGRNIVGYHDFLKSTELDAPFVIVIPGYGETKRDALTIAYYFAVNGFNVIRYDATDHLGESDGEILNFTLPKLKDDLLAAVDYIEKNFNHKKVAVVAASLSGRAAIRAASEDGRINFLGLLVPVVNLQHTVNAVYGEDIIGDVKKGKIKKFYDIFGFDADKEAFCSAIKNNFNSLMYTVIDAQNIECSTVVIAAENDVWNKKKDISSFFENIKSAKKESYVIEDSLHQLFENPEKAKEAIQYLVSSATKELLNRTNPVVEPPLKQLSIQNRKEKKRLAQLNLITLESEQKFWDDYMLDFKTIIKVKDYRDYLNDITNLLGAYKKNQKILDAGCGVGHYGAWLFVYYLNLCKELKSPEFKKISPIDYYGLDLTLNNIQISEKKHRDLQNNFYDNFKENINCVNFSYIQQDLNNPLSYQDNMFHKIISSLVLSYVADPLFSCRELLRVLMPNGTLVVSSLKPYSDLSRLYCKFLDIAETQTDIEEVRNLLSSAGQIKRKEGEGHYNFFTEQELKNLLISAGAKEVKVFRTFGNQANIAVGIKRR